MLQRGGVSAHGVPPPVVLGRSAFASAPPVVRLALLAVVPRHAHPLQWARDHFSIVGVNCLCPELMRWDQNGGHT